MISLQHSSTRIYQLEDDRNYKDGMSQESIWNFLPSFWMVAITTTNVANQSHLIYISIQDLQQNA
jgi:hypothetical protein